MNGLFWETPVGAKLERYRPTPPVPATVAPFVRLTELPNLERASVISVDVETKDLSLEAGLGPGWARAGGGHICGVSIGADNDGRWYFPLRHEIEPETNYSPYKVLRWLHTQLGRDNQPKVGANLTYDVGWLRQEGVNVMGDLYDVQFAEAILDESALVALEILARKYLQAGKESSELYDWLSYAYGGESGPSQRKNIYRAPPRLAAAYAISDINLPIKIMERQHELLYKRGLLPLFRMECDLIPLMIAMRFAGVPVDVERAEQVRDELTAEEVTLNGELAAMVGFPVNVDAAADLAKAFDALKLQYPLTEKTKKPSFTKDWLNALTHPVGKKIREVRSVAKTRGTFVENYILKAHVNGKIFPQFHQLKDDENGTVTGRFSGSNPNYQNLPSKDGRLGPLCRSITVPENGHKQWRKFDLSQIQYRFLAHYAIGQGSDAVRKVFTENADADYHNIVQDMVRSVTGIQVDRKPIKNINFGLMFGMGKTHLAETNSWKRDFADKVFDAYHRGAPYVKATMDWASGEAALYGVVRTILGRETHFNLWEPMQWGTDMPALPYTRAVEAYGQVRRAGTHKALCNILQGSEGDLMKSAMLKCWRDGVFDVTGVPRITVHDELDFSDSGTCDEAFDEVQRIMETVIPLKIPVKAGCDVGPNWGACK